MTLFIATTDGTDTFRVAQVQVDLISISQVDSGIGFDEDNVQTFEGIDTFQVTYTQNETGPTSDRLDELVNDIGFASPPHIIIFGMDDDYTLSDGTPVPVFGNGVAIPVGNSLNPFTNHVATFYDVTLCGGAGIWVDAEGGGTTQETTDVILYHELSHCFHFVTGTADPDLGQEEVNAEIDENDMRDVRGLPHRDVNSHNGGCGGGTVSCCIIASLATGSPYSSEVNRLRYFREHVLRRSQVGDDFFNRFHYQYYGFSPEVCRLIGHQPSLGALIKQHFVVPLLAALELLIHYTDNKGQGLVDFLRQQAKREEFAEIYRPHFLDELRVFVELAETFDQEAISMTLLSRDGDLIGATDLMSYVNQQTVKDGFINWSLVQPLKIWLSSAFLLTVEESDGEINAEIYSLISEWAAHLPITSIWREFSRLETEIELERLEQFIFDRKSKEAFADRLINTHCPHATTIRQWAQN
jgi:hypothetical protein